MNGCVLIFKGIAQFMAVMAARAVHRRSRCFVCNLYANDEVVEGNAKKCVGACTHNTS